MVTYISRDNDIIAEIAPQGVFAAVFRCRSMAHHHIRIKPKRSVQHDLVGCLAHECGQPPRFTTIHKHEDGVMRVHKLLKFDKLLFRPNFVPDGVP